MYKTILVTLDGTPTDRAIIEHIKQLAKLTQGRVVLLHVADGWAARTFGPDAVSPEITEDTAYLNQVRVGVSIRRHSRRGGTGLRRAAEGNRQMGRAKGLRPGGDEHARPPLYRGHLSWRNRQPRSASDQRAGSPSSGEINHGRHLQKGTVVSANYPLSLPPPPKVLEFAVGGVYPI